MPANAIDMDPPHGTIVFTTVGLPHYGFDVFSVTLPADFPSSHLTDTRLTDGISVNFNAQLVVDDDDDNNNAIVFVSERTGAFNIYLARPNSPTPEPLPGIPGSLFHDRPTLHKGRLYFVSTHEPAAEPFKSWAAVYSTRLDTKQTVRLTPPGSTDLSPAVSPAGDLVAVASYRSGIWKGDFRDLDTEIVIFRTSDTAKRVSISSGIGGWPAWSGDSTVFFHRKAEDGWWSIYRVDLDGLEVVGPVRRVTPLGLHAFTPSGTSDGKRIAVATRRKGRAFRHIEIYDLESEQFFPVTELINPNLHHYNPFFSPSDPTRLGYHRFRGESADAGELIVPHLQPVVSPVTGIRLLRLNGSFPSFSPDGRLMVINGDDFIRRPGLMILKSDGSKRWDVIKGTVAFCTSWSPAEKGVVYSSLGPIFESTKTTVQIARVMFNQDDLDGTEADEIPVEVKILTSEYTGNNAFPSCSPDGKSIVFRSGRSGHKNLYIVDAVNGESDSGEGIRRLTEGDWIDTMPCWSPRGDLIGFSSNRHSPDNPEVFSIYLVRPDGTGLRRVPVAGPNGSDRERINHVCFGPDGEWLLFTANVGAVNAESISMPNQFQPYGDLYVCRLDGTGLRRLTSNGFENGTPTWHSGGPEMEFGRLTLAEGVGEPLKGQFDEPLWLTGEI